MGSAFCAVRNDVNSIFYNPGSLPWSKGLGVTFSDFSNISAVQVYPTGFGSSVGLAINTHKVTDFLTMSGSSAAISSNTLVVSFATKLSVLPFLADSDFFERLGLGLSLKTLFGETLAETGALDLTGNGVDMDCGILYKYSSWIALGASLNNFIPSGTLGLGTLSWTNLSEEGLPAYLKVGIALKPIGDVLSPYHWEDNELQLSADYEYLNGSRLSLFHLGGELLISNYIFRAGLTQYQHLSEVKSGFTLGFGLRFVDWNLNLAYAPEPLKDQGTLYLSASYFPEGWKFVSSPILEISLYDGLTTYDDKITVSGEVDPAIEEIYLNHKRLDLDSQHCFKTTAPLVIGENILIIETRYEGEKTKRIYSVIRKEHPGSPVESISIRDGDTVYTNFLEITGQAEPGPGLFIDERPIDVFLDKSFSSIIPLEMGKNKILVERRYDGYMVSEEYTVFRKAAPKETAEEIEARKRTKAEARAKAEAEAKAKAKVKRKRPTLTKTQLRARRARYLAQQRKKAKEKAARLKKLRAQKLKEQKEEAPLKAKVAARKKEMLEAGRIARMKKEHENFLKLQALIKKKVDLVIIARAKIKVPEGYLAVYIIRGMDRYIALRYIGQGLVNIDLYNANNSAWTTLNTVAYDDIKDLI